MPEPLSTRAAIAAEIRRCGGVTGALESGLGVDHMPDREMRDAWTRLVHVHDAYTHAIRDFEHLLPNLVHHPIRPTEPAPFDELTSGRIVYRYTEPAGRLLESWMPCCGRALRVNPDTEAVWAICCSCRLAYELTLEDDLDGGHVAMFVVTGRPLVVAKHRSARPTALSPPPHSNEPR